MKKSKSGEFSPHINKEVAEKINLLCGLTGENRTNYVSRVVSEAVDIDITNIREILKKERIK
jgi:hypothetical protein